MMSLSESLLGEPEHSEPSARSRVPTLPASAQPPGENDAVRKLREVLEGLFVIENVQQLQQNGQTVPNVLVFQGRLLGDAEALYPLINRQFNALGFTPMLRRVGSTDQIITFQGLIKPRTFASPIWLHLVLLIATIITTTISGAGFQGYTLSMFVNALEAGNGALLMRMVQAGAPFALTLLLILGVHEMGHYVAARRHGVSVTLPYFIPFPFLLLGTLGAVIFIKSPLHNRKSLFDVGISGPLAGFVVALVAFVISMYLRPFDRPNMLLYQISGGERLGMPILLQTIGDVLRPDIANLSRFVARQPVALAAWFGMLLTVLNLLPIGQLDGGHVMYSLFGRAAWQIALGAFGLMIFLGLTVFPSLIFFSLLALMTGLRHPPPGNDITPLDPFRRYLGYATIVLFFLIGTATPFIVGR